MKVNFSFKHHFIHRLYFYIGALVLIPSLVTYGVILRTNPKKEELFTIFIEANIENPNAFKDFIKLNTNEKNKETTLYSSLSSMSTFQIIYQTQGLESDLIILSDNAFKNDYVSNYIELSEKDYLYSETNKQVEDKHFGIEIFNGKDGFLTQYIKYKSETKYYAFLNKSSVHTNPYSKEGTTKQIYRLLEAIYGEK